jgi:hypothetical protein
VEQPGEKEPDQEIGGALGAEVESLIGDADRSLDHRWISDVLPYVVETECRSIRPGSLHFSSGATFSAGNS